MLYLKICLTGTDSLALLSAPVTKPKRILQHAVVTTSRTIYLSTYAFTYSCTYLLMYSCTLYTCTHVLSTHLIYLYTCTRVLCTHALMVRTHVTVYSVLMHSCTCTHVPVYSVLKRPCIILVNVRHSATATMSMTNISVYILYISGPANNLKNTSHTYSVSSSSSSR